MLVNYNSKYKKPDPQDNLEAEGKHHHGRSDESDGDFEFDEEENYHNISFKR